MMEFLKYISIIIKKKIVRCVKKNENLWDTKFNKVIMSRVILEANVVLKRPYTRTVRRKGEPWPRQWHISRGGSTVEEEF